MKPLEFAIFPGITRLGNVMGEPMQADEKKRVLVVAMTPGKDRALTEALDASGHEVRMARGDAGCLDTAREWIPEVFVFRRALSAERVVELCRAVKADADLRPIHLIVEVESEDAVQVLEAGADDVVTGSPHPTEMVARVAAGVRVREIQRELVDAEHRKVLLEMAATLGHEVNNPLTALFGHLELVMQYLDRGDGQRVRHHLEVAGSVASRIGEVAQRLMLMAEPRMKRYLGRQEMLDIHEGQENPATSSEDRRSA
jgi:DNA-binding response OmpR family regulator